MRGMHQEHINAEQRAQVGELFQSSDEDKGLRQHLYWLATWDLYLSVPATGDYYKRQAILDRLKTMKCA